MKLLSLLGLMSLMGTVLFNISQLLYLLSFRPYEKVPEDAFLLAENHKKALVLVAHDDESATFAGTVAFLRENGWEIDFACFYGEHHGARFDELRKKETLEASAIQRFSEVHLFDFKMPKEDHISHQNSYMPIPLDQFEYYFKMDSLRLILSDLLIKSQASVIFTLDHSIGGYGHPEHVLVGQTARKVADSLNHLGLTRVGRFYQYVYPDSQEEKVTAGLPVYEAAKLIYNADDGMPSPTTFVAISKYGEEKMRVLRTYTTGAKNLKKFVKLYLDYPGWFYFRFFDKEYFAVIDLEKEKNQIQSEK